MHVVGTAGHVDHGKSALVEALTGTNPDRWVEERERGMTLDLGFAHLIFDGGLEAGIVDVPGHERFLRNMIAGAPGMELLLLVVAANEGVMPQTREHLAILRYLNVAQTIVVASKIDLVAPLERETALAAIAAGVADTIAWDAPVVPASALTREGLPALRELIARTLDALPARSDDAPAYLPVDRVFTIPGAGTVVTGTLMQGTIAAGETLSLRPGDRAVRVRGLHVFGAPRERASGGTRVALNLAGVGRDDAARGSVVADSQLAAATRLDVRFLPYEPEVTRLRRRTSVRAHLGAAEIQGTLVLPRERPDEGPWNAHLLLRHPAVAFPGLRFVLRNLSPNVLLGGGDVLASDSTSSPVVDRELRGASTRAVAGVLRARSGEALEPAIVANAANLREDRAVAILEALVERGDAIAVQRPVAYVDASAASALLARALDLLEASERDEPWSLGTTSLALARALGVSEPLLIRILGAFAAGGRISHRSGYYATPGHRPRLTSEQHRLFDQVAANDASPFLPVAFARVASAVATSGVPGAKKAFETLLARGALVKVGDDLYREIQIAEIRAKVESFVHERGGMTPAQFRDLIGTSRKFAVPLLEWLDGRGVTVRDGDRRVLRR